MMLENPPPQTDNHLFTSDSDGWLKQFRITDGALVKDYENVMVSIYSTASTRNGKYLFVGGNWN